MGPFRAQSGPGTVTYHSLTDCHMSVVKGSNVHDTVSGKRLYVHHTVSGKRL